MILAITFAVVAGTVGFLGGCLWGGIHVAERLAGAESLRDEYQRRLNRIIETDSGVPVTHPMLELHYAVAKGERV